jgi:hypothetical protein
VTPQDEHEERPTGGGLKTWGKPEFKRFSAAAASAGGGPVNGADADTVKS